MGVVVVGGVGVGVGGGGIPKRDRVHIIGNGGRWTLPFYIMDIDRAYDYVKGGLL